MTERKHAVLGPSSSERWSTCPGSVQLESTYPDSSSDAADWGTACHQVSEWCLTDWFADPTDARPAAAFKGRRIDVGPAKTVEVDDEMAETAQTYVDNVRDRIAMYEAAGALSVELHVEVAVPVDHVTGEEDAKGTADAVIVATFIDKVVVDVNDLKGGRGVKVDAYKNKQLTMYASGAIRKLELQEVDEVVLVIHQPRVSETPSEYSMSMAEFEAATQEIVQAAQRAILFVDSTTPPTLSDLVPSDKGCKFCRAKATCPAMDRLVQDTIGADFEVLGPSDIGGVNPIEDLTAAAPADLGLKMRAVDQVEGWCKAIRAEVERRLFEQGNTPEAIQALGQKLVQGRKGSRAWSDAETAEQTLKTMRLKTEEMYEFKLISPTSAEKLAKAGAIGPRQWPKLQDLITQSEGSPSVAPADDKRPALVIQKPSADDFEVLEEDLV